MVPLMAAAFTLAQTHRRKAANQNPKQPPGRLAPFSPSMSLCKNAGRCRGEKKPHYAKLKTGGRKSLRAEQVPHPLIPAPGRGRQPRHSATNPQPQGQLRAGNAASKE